MYSYRTEYTRKSVGLSVVDDLNIISYGYMLSDARCMVMHGSQLEARDAVHRRM